MILLSMAAAFSGGAAMSRLWRWAHAHVATPARPAADSTASSVALPPPAEWTRYAGARPEVGGFPPESVLAVRGLDKLPPGGIDVLLDVARQLGMPVDTLAAVIAHESGWKPEALYFRDTNDDGTPRKVPFVAAGLCQLTVQAHLDGFGDWQRVREVASWPVERQLREVVLPLWAKYGERARKAHPGLGLMLNFLPDKAGAPESTVLGVKDAPGFSGRVYAMNHGLDTDGDTKITVGDVYTSAARVCHGARGQRLRRDGSIWLPPRPFAPKASPGDTAARGAMLKVAVPSEPPPRAETAPVKAPAAPVTSRPPAARPLPGRSSPLRLGDPSAGLLLAAIRAGTEEPPTWIDLLWEGRGKTEGVRLTLKVSAHTVRAPVEIQGLGTRLLRLPVSYREQIEICRLRRWFPLTQSISDAIWAAAFRLRPPTLGTWDTPEEAAESSRLMDKMDWTLRFNDQLDRQIPPDAAGKLCAPEGKEWIVHPRVERPDGQGAVNYGLHRLDGVPWQPPGAKHDWNHSDYSQPMRAMQWFGIDAEGREVSVLETLRKAGMPAAVLAPFEGIAGV